MKEVLSNPEFESRRELFLTDLANFIIAAGNSGWAADVEKLKRPQRPKFKEFPSFRSGDWEYHDSYAGYFMAPGSSVVYYKGRPAWYMTYGGPGQREEAYPRAKETYAFLRRALLEPEPRFPVRGPMRYEEENGHKYYRFNYSGDLAEGSWDESIDLDFREVFVQRGDVGLIIDKDEKYNPIYPWDL